MVYQAVDPEIVVPPEHMGVWLDGKMEARKISARYLGRLSGVNNSVISRLLNGADPELRTVVNLFEALKVDDREAYEVILSQVPTSAREGRATRLIHLPNSPALVGSVGEQLRGYRLIRGLSARGAGLVTGSNYSSVIRRELDQRLPDLDQYAATAYAYGLNVGQNAGILDSVREMRPVNADLVPGE